MADIKVIRLWQCHGSVQSIFAISVPADTNARFDFKVRNMLNDHKSCAFIAVIRAFACIPDQWFINALERRIADAQQNRTYNNTRTNTDAEICTKLLELVDKGSFPDAWVGQSMKEVRFLLAKSEAEKNTTAADSFTKNIDMDPFRVIQAIISCLRDEDQKAFQFRSMNVVRCPNPNCRRVRLKAVAGLMIRLFCSFPTLTSPFLCQVT